MKGVPAEHLGLMLSARMAFEETATGAAYWNDEQRRDTLRAFEEGMEAGFWIVMRIMTKEPHTTESLMETLSRLRALLISEEETSFEPPPPPPFLHLVK